MPETNDLLARGIAMAREGQEAGARSLLQAAIEKEPENQLAWGWYVQSFSDEDARIRAFDEYLRVFPGDRQARKLRESLYGRRFAHWKGLAVDAIRGEEQARQALEAEKARSRRSLRAWVVALSLLLIAALLFANARSSLRVDEMEVRLETLAVQHAMLLQEQRTLQSAYSSLNADNAALMADHVALDRRYRELGAAYAALDERYAGLNAQHQALYSEYQSLATQYAALTGEYDRLEHISLQPPYISVHNREFTMAFYDLDRNLVYWTTPFSNLEYFILQGDKTRDRMFNYREHMNTLYLDDGRPFTTGDYSLYFDSYSFTRVVETLYAESGSPDEFIRQVWQIVGQLSDYHSDDGFETPRFPSETMLAGGGDCEDLSILFASMLKAAPTNWDVDLVYIDSERVLDPQDPDHVIVYINTGQRVYLVETTSDTTMEPYPNGVRGWLNRQVNMQRESDRYPVYLR